MWIGIEPLSAQEAVPPKTELVLQYATVMYLEYPMLRMTE
jgi:hypothetical protein